MVCFGMFWLWRLKCMLRKQTSLENVFIKNQQDIPDITCLHQAGWTCSFKTWVMTNRPAHEIPRDPEPKLSVPWSKITHVGVSSTWASLSGRATVTSTELPKSTTTPQRESLGKAAKTSREPLKGTDPLLRIVYRVVAVRRRCMDCHVPILRLHPLARFESCKRSVHGSSLSQHGLETLARRLLHCLQSRC